MTQVLDKGSNFVRDLGEAARENPLSAALIGMGVLWMFGGSAATVARRVGIDRMPDPRGVVSEATNSLLNTGAAVGDSIASATSSVQRSASDALEGATRFGREQANTLAQQARSNADSTGEMMNTATSATRKVQDSASSALEGATRFGREQTDALAQYARSIPESGGQMVNTLRSNLSDLF